MFQGVPYSVPFSLWALLRSTEENINLTLSQLLWPFRCCSSQNCRNLPVSSCTGTLNFESASLAFSISVPVHDDTGKFRHFCEDTKMALRVQFFRGLSRKWSTIYRGKYRTSWCWWTFLPLTLFFALKSFAKKVKKIKQNNINKIQASL